MGFIGLGNMGAHMAQNLMKAGYPLVVSDINKSVLDRFASLGAKVKLGKGAGLWERKLLRA